MKIVKMCACAYCGKKDTIHLHFYESHEGIHTYVYTILYTLYNTIQYYTILTGTLVLSTSGLGTECPSLVRGGYK